MFKSDISLQAWTQCLRVLVSSHDLSVICEDAGKSGLHWIWFWMCFLPPPLLFYMASELEEAVSRSERQKECTSTCVCVYMLREEQAFQ